MLDFEIRRGKAEDASLITDLIKSMVAEMALLGGYEINSSPPVWSSMAALVRANCSRPDYLYLIASQETPLETILGLAVANIEPLEAIFIAKPRLHISALYTLPAVRRQGVARLLIQNILDWGRRMNAEEADLNVLATNPARRLYEQIGFMAHEISMVKAISSQPGEA
jgi:GNAT superfamily N-acetyltransferase